MKKEHLTCLTKLEVNYKYLRWITRDFTKKLTRKNRRHMKRLVLKETIVHSKNFYIHFSLLLN